MQEQDFKQALNYSFFLLKYRARSKYEIVSRLKRKKYSVAAIDKTIAFLEENNYINDANFIQAFILQALEKGWGARRIDYNLKKLGIGCEARSQALAGIDQRQRIRELIGKYLAGYKNKKDIAPQKVWQKIVRFLVAKGFDYQDIFQEMDELGVRRFEDS